MSAAVSEGPHPEKLRDEHRKIDLDTILVNEIGQFGWFQLRVLLLTVVVVIFAAWGASEYVFTTSRINTRCRIPQCDIDEPEYSPGWILNAVPGTESSFDNCQRYGNLSVAVSSRVCPAELFDRNVLLPCEDYVYETTHTVVYDYGLACDEWRRTLIGSVRIFGTLTALPITGFVSDRWGRRTALALNAFNTAWLGVTRYFAGTYIGFMISEFVEATFGSGGFSTAYILVMEVVGPKYRVVAGATINTFFSVGQISMGLIAWAVPNWRMFTLTLYIPQLLTIVYFWIMTESVRWYMSKGHYEESEALLQKIAKTNGKQLSPASLAALRQTAEEENKRKALEEIENVSEPWLIVLVFRHKKILLRCLVSPVWWITTTFIYYGMSINSVNMSGNRYLNYVAVSAVEIPGYWTAVFLMGKIGRRPVVMAAFWVCAACQVAYIFLPTDMYAASLTVYLIGKYSIAMVMTSIYVYTAELYPTKYRHSLFAFSSMMGRIGNIVAPLTPAFYSSSSYWPQHKCCTMSNPEKGGKRDGVDLDHILVNEVGQFGRYQLITLALAALPIIFSAFAAGEYIFTTARIPTRCMIPQCDGANPEYAPSWLLNAIPGTSIDSFENCEQFSNSTVQVPVQNGTCPAALFDRTSTTECTGHVYENTLSVVYDFDMACDEWRRSQIGSIRTIGTLLVLPITGYISDRWGRRVALTINAFNTGWIGLVRSFVNSYEWFLALEVLESSVGAGAYSSCYILVTELVGPKYRVVAGATISTLFALGQVFLGLIAWGVPSWRSLTQVLYAPQVLVISYFWILSESVRWLMSKGRYEESEQILKKVAKANKKELSQESLEALQATAEAEKNVVKAKEPWLIFLVFRSKILLSRCLVSPVWWITNTLIYYGMGINAVNMSGNRYLNYVAVAAIEIPGYWTAILLLDRIGRKPVLICAYWLCACCQFAFAFLPDGMPGLSLFLYLFGKYCIAVVMTSVYVYTAELYPTKYRHNLFAFSSMVGRLGSITAPLTPALAQEVWEPFPSVLFGSFALLSGMLIFTTPETLGTKLPDTIEDAEQLGQKHNKIVT